MRTFFGHLTRFLGLLTLWTILNGSRNEFEVLARGVVVPAALKRCGVARFTYFEALFGFRALRNVLVNSNIFSSMHSFVAIPISPETRMNKDSSVSHSS